MPEARSFCATTSFNGGRAWNNRSAIVPLASLTYASPVLIAATNEVVVTDRGSAALGQHHRRVRAELDGQGRVRQQCDLLDLAHLDSRDPHEVAAFQPGDVAELRLIDVLFVEPKLREDRQQ